MSFASRPNPPNPPKDDDPSVQALFEEIDAEVKSENLKKFFKRYGNAIGVAMLVVVLGTAAFSAWGGWISGQREKETAVLITLMDRNPASFTDEELKSVMETLVRLGKDGHGEGIRLAAGVAEVSILMKKDQKDAALERLAAMGKDGRLSPVYRDYATLQSIRLRMDGGDAQKLITELQPLLKNDNAWFYSATQLTAMLEVRTGKSEQAIQRLQGIVDTSHAPLVAREEAAQLLRLYKAM